MRFLLPEQKTLCVSVTRQNVKEHGAYSYNTFRHKMNPLLIGRLNILASDHRLFIKICFVKW